MQPYAIPCPPSRPPTPEEILKALHTEDDKTRRLCEAIGTFLTTIGGEKEAEELADALYMYLDRGIGRQIFELENSPPVPAAEQWSPPQFDADEALRKLADVTAHCEELTNQIETIESHKENSPRELMANIETGLTYFKMQLRQYQESRDYLQKEFESHQAKGAQ